MVSVEQARARILGAVGPLAPVELTLDEALGLVLAAEVRAPRDVPPRANAAMDGYAVRAQDIADAGLDNPVVLPVAQEISAGSADELALAPGAAARIMTGAPVPPGADAVVPFEDTDEEARGTDRRQVGVFRPVARGANVRPAGEDVRAGDLVLAPGTILRPAHLGLAASLGLPTLAVHRPPRVAILSTGDELLPPGAPARPGAIYDANGTALTAAIREAGGVLIALGIAPDDAEELAARLDRARREADLVVTSAGVSRGDFDLVKTVLARMGVVEFWQVAIRPGRPLAFGHLGQTPLVGLPGNPVAALVGFEVFVRPAIRKLLGADGPSRPVVEATIHGTARNPDGRRCYLRAAVEREGDAWTATLIEPRGSGILSSLARANGLVVVPEQVQQVNDGDRLHVLLLEWPG